MKHTLAHLPPRKQRQLTALVALIREAAPVEMIILFGSHARGDWVEDLETGYRSDYDILVIVKSPAVVMKHKLWSTIENRAEKIAAPTEASFIVHDIKDVNRQLEKGLYFFGDIKKEGIVLYDTQRFTLAKEKKHTPEERQSFARESFDQWFTSANEFYRYFEFGFAERAYKSSAFQLHQATERYYHAILLVFTAYKPKIHNIEILGKKCGDLHPAFRSVFPRATPEEDRLFKLLKNAYVDARYSSTYTITGEELTLLAAHVRDLRDRTERVCREKIAAMAPASSPGGFS